MATLDLYAVLGIERTATSAEIKKAYRRLAKACHPDSFLKREEEYTDALREQWANISRANNTLMDEEARQRYDTTGEFSEGPVIDTVTADALTNLTGLFMKLVDTNEDPTKVDLIEEMRVTLRETMKELDGFEKNDRKKIEKYEKVRGRTKNLRGKDNILAGVMRDKIAQLNKALEGYDEERVVCRRMREIVDEHGFDWMQAEMNDHWETTAARREGKEFLQRIGGPSKTGTRGFPVPR